MDELVYAPDFDSVAIQNYVTAAGGDLAGVPLYVDGRRYAFGEALIGQTLYYSVSPKIILALIEYQADLVTQPNQPNERYTWAVGYGGEEGRFAGFGAQMRWATREMFYARRDLPTRPALRFADGDAPAPAYLSNAQYVVARLLAPTIRSDRLDVALWQFNDTYERLFGALPVQIPVGTTPPVILQWPLQTPVPISSFFDHGGPFLTRDMPAGIVTYWGHNETDMAFAYNGHDGWDYAAAPPDPVLAAAAGTVIFAGIADDNCDTRAVIVDHGDDLRTLYWHLSQITVDVGQPVIAGAQLGVVGNTGCSKGPHLHFGVQYRGVGIDPYGWCSSTPDPWATHPAGIKSVWLWADSPSPCAPPAPGSVLVDSSDSTQFAVVATTLTTVETGVGNTAMFAAAQRGADRMRPWRARPLVPLAMSHWHAVIPNPGRYRVLVYIPYALSGLIDSDGVFFQISHRDGVSEMPVNMQTAANEWVDLGTYQFEGSGDVILPMRDAIGDRGVWADAVLWQPVTGAIP
jgi:murein DD-endopeptidase MepM/ murein hydrolase activator NlpD